MKTLGQNKKSVPSKSDREESDESSDDEVDNQSGDDEKEFVSSLKSLATSPREKKPMVKNPAKGLEKKLKSSKASKTKQTTVKEVENSQMVVKVLDLKGESKDAISVGQKKKGDVSQSYVQSNKPETKKSSFFVGGESEDDSGGEEDEEEEEGGHQPWQAAPGRGEGFFSKKTGGGEFTGGRGQGRGRDGRGPVKGGTGLTEDANLHPSWQAKKRAAPAMAQFQGKKTKFGSEGEAVKSNPTPSKIAQSQEPVHPSWAAKQSQKSTIQSFQGKKMVFDD